MDECKKCGYKSPIISECIDKLLPMLDQNVSSEELLSLYTLKPLGYDKINMLLSLSGVEEYLINKESKILSQTKYELSDEKIMLYFIENNFPNKNEMINRLIREMLLDNLNIDIEEKLSLFKFFTKYIMSENSQGNIRNNVIIDENEVRELFLQKRYLNLIEFIFYKCIYAYLNSTLYSDKISPFLLRKIKEEIISDNLPGYYEENHYIQFIETEARYNANILLQEYISALGFKISDILKLCYEEKRKNDFKLLNSEYRLYKGKRVSIDDLFLETISKSDDIASIFEKYPLLNNEIINVTKKL